MRYDVQWGICYDVGGYDSSERSVIRINPKTGELEEARTEHLKMLIDHKGYVDEPVTVHRKNADGEWVTTTLDHLDLDNVWHPMDWFKDENYLPWKRKQKAKETETPGA